MSNYDIQLRHAAAAFTAYDTGALAQTFGLSYDENFLYLNFLSQPQCVCRKTGAVFRKSDGADAGFHVAMTVYDMLTNPHGLPILSGRWCAHKHFNAVRGGTLQGTLELSNEHRALEGKCDALRTACRALGGKETTGGDFSAILPLFDFFPVFLRFYDADEEFAPQLQLLWDAETTKYLRFETTFYTCGAIISALYHKLGISV